MNKPILTHCYLLKFTVYSHFLSFYLMSSFLSLILLITTLHVVVLSSKAFFGYDSFSDFLCFLKYVFIALERKEGREGKKEGGDGE